MHVGGTRHWRMVVAQLLDVGKRRLHHRRSLNVEHEVRDDHALQGLGDPGRTIARLAPERREDVVDRHQPFGLVNRHPRRSATHGRARHGGARGRAAARTARHRVAGHVGAVVDIHAQVVVHLDAVGPRDAVEHVAPVVVAGGGIGGPGGVAVVPFLAGHLGADLVGHDRAVMGQVAHRKATRLEPARAGAQDHRLRLDGDRLLGIEQEARSPGDAAVFLDQMGDDHPLDQGNVTLLDRHHEGAIGQGLVEEAPFPQFLRTGQGMLGQLASVDGVVGAERRARHGVGELVHGHGFGVGVIDEEPLGEGRETR